MDSAVLVGWIKVIGISLVPVLLVGAFLRAEAIYGWWIAFARKLHLLRLPPAPPAGPPLEKLASDLRRLYPLAYFPQPGVRMPKQRGILMAYDERLVDTARALDVPTALLELPQDSFDRAAERLRLEHALTDAGLSWRAQQP